MSLKGRGWQLFDAIVADAPGRPINPWVALPGGAAAYEPDYDTLRRLLGVPLLLGAKSQSGLPALAFDVWTAYELRRAGFDKDAVWPRDTAPRVLPSEIATLLRALKGPLQKSLAERISRGTGLGGAVGANANLLGKNYLKQVDVVISAWNTGPELMISTKRMDSSFGKNAANRVEESYGDAKNLRLRHPQAALGFMYGLRSTALTKEPDKADWLIDLLIKLGREDDAYDCVALVIPEWVGGTSSDASGEPEGDDDDGDNPLAAAGLEPSPDDTTETEELDADVSAEQLFSAAEVAEQLGLLPEVALRQDAVPPELDPGRFFATMTRRILDNCPITLHKPARGMLKAPRGVPSS